MTEEIKDVNAKIDEVEAAVKKYASKDTVISIGGYEFTPAKLMVAFTIASAVLGSLYSGFEIYKDYMDMKKKIANYVTPDLTEIYKKMEVLDANTAKMTEYTNNIKNDLKGDVRRLEGVVENVERSSKQDSRSTDQTVKDVKRDVDATLKQITSDVKDARKYTDDTIRDVNRDMIRNQKETAAEIKSLRGDVDDKIKKALDNPLSK
jgi:uncharacterized protein YoxC